MVTYCQLTGMVALASIQGHPANRVGELLPHRWLAAKNAVAKPA